MNSENERKKFKNQYTEEEWSSLMRGASFKVAWDSGDLTKAGEIASIEVEGDTRTMREARVRKEVNEIVRQYR